MRKYLCEFALNVLMSNKTIISPDTLDDTQANMENYHLYAILLQDKMFLDITSIMKTKEALSFTIFSLSNGAKKHFPIQNIVLHSEIDHTKVNIISEYPHDRLSFQVCDKDFLHFNDTLKDDILSISDLYSIVAYDMGFEILYKILYIGQSYGKDGERNAVDRLSNHSTLQKILAKSQSDYSQHYIKILLMEPAPILGMSFDGISKNYKASSEEDDEHMKAVITTEKKEKQIVNITEAALVNYFKPEYNATFKENFPCDTHSSYCQYYDLDFNSITIELSMSFQHMPYIQLYTETNRHCSEWDIIRYPLDADPNRDSMYAIFKAHI